MHGQKWPTGLFQPPKDKAGSRVAEQIQNRKDWTKDQRRRETKCNRQTGPWSVFYWILTLLSTQSQNLSFFLVLQQRKYYRLSGNIFRYSFSSWPTVRPSGKKSNLFTNAYSQGVVSQSSIITPCCTGRTRLVCLRSTEQNRKSNGRFFLKDRPCAWHDCKIPDAWYRWLGNKFWFDNHADALDGIEVDQSSRWNSLMKWSNHR